MRVFLFGDLEMSMTNSVMAKRLKYNATDSRGGLRRHLLRRLLKPDRERVHHVRERDHREGPPLKPGARAVLDFARVAEGDHQGRGSAQAPGHLRRLLRR